MCVCIDIGICVYISAKDKNKQFTEQEALVANKHEKHYLISLVNRVMQCITLSNWQKCPSDNISSYLESDKYTLFMKV